MRTPCFRNCDARAAVVAMLGSAHRLCICMRDSNATHSRFSPPLSPLLLLQLGELESYRYYDAATRGLDFEGMCADLRAVPEGSIILLHACAHNPTGVDPTPEQWVILRSILKERNALPWFDTAYQGFASGSPDTDAATIRMFAEEVRSCMRALLRAMLPSAGAAGTHFSCVLHLRYAVYVASTCRAMSSLCASRLPRTLACTQSALARCT